MATQVSSGREAGKPASKALSRLKAAGIVFTFLGLGLFVYFIYATGLSEIGEGISRVGLSGFALILFIYLLRVSVRATAWGLSVYGPYELKFRDTFPAVIIGEALSSLIPLGILISGTAKAVAVRRKVPLVVGLSSVATENIFYSFITALFISFGSILFLRSFDLEPEYVWLIDIVLIFIVLIFAFVTLMIVRQWHWASGICERLYERGILTGVLNSGRLQVRLFENLIYGYYRRYPKRFVPILLLQVAFHTLGVVEVLFILSKISGTFQLFSTAFFLETISRLITIVFKLIPFVIGVDEAGAEFVVKTLALGAGIGVTLAIVRKARVLFWAIVGVILIVKRGIRLKDIRNVQEEVEEIG
ncbi:MAG TPA: lysylphosphatidylglycerol synthase domain-containing protein [Aridibacter sp.]|nr:lysylphosphatidylglycerol synthase domain-containing protein [Aridibacter sp.]